jgi:hypothetical protein
LDDYHRKMSFFLKGGYELKKWRENGVILAGDWRAVWR